jgi:hypothetical protein
VADRSIHALTGLRSRTALCLDATFCVLLALAFMEFCRLLYDDRGVLPWAALILAHEAEQLLRLHHPASATGRCCSSFCAWLRHLR